MRFQALAKANEVLLQAETSHLNRGAGKMVESCSSIEKINPFNLMHPSRKRNVLNNETIQ